jgi:hypothetical protein
MLTWFYVVGGKICRTQTSSSLMFAMQEMVQQQRCLKATRILSLGHGDGRNQRLALLGRALYHRLSQNVRHRRRQRPKRCFTRMLCHPVMPVKRAEYVNRQSWKVTCKKQMYSTHQRLPDSELNIMLRSSHLRQHRIRNCEIAVTRRSL